MNPVYIYTYIYIATTPLFWVVKVGNLKIESCFSTIVKDSSEIHMFSANFPCAYHGMLGRIHTLTNEKLGCIRLYLTTWNGNAITNKNREIETNKHGEHQTIKLGLGIGTKKRDFIIWSSSMAGKSPNLMWRQSSRSRSEYVDREIPANQPLLENPSHPAVSDMVPNSINSGPLGSRCSCT